MTRCLPRLAIKSSGKIGFPQRRVAAGGLVTVVGECDDVVVLASLSSAEPGVGVSGRISERASATSSPARNASVSGNGSLFVAPGGLPRLNHRSTDVGLEARTADPGTVACLRRGDQRQHPAVRAADQVSEPPPLDKRPIITTTARSIGKSAMNSSRYGSAAGPSASLALTLRAVGDTCQGTAFQLR
jgi:hypothetical protein